VVTVLDNAKRCHFPLTQLFHQPSNLPTAILLTALIFGKDIRAAGETIDYFALFWFLVMERLQAKGA
jgi:hypothetical protein